MDTLCIKMVISLIRIFLIMGMFFWLIPRLFAGEYRTRNKEWDGMTDFLLAVCFALVMNYTLLLVGIHDMLVVALFLIAVIAAGAVTQYGGVSKFIYFFSMTFLRAVESNYVLKAQAKKVKKFKSRMKRILTKPATILGLFIVLFTGGFRLYPALHHPAPFAIETYHVIEQVKSLEANDVTELRRMMPGLPLFLDFLHLLTRTDVAVLAHVFGAITTILLMIAIFYFVRNVTGNVYAGIVGMALWGLYFKLLPISVHHQVEADSILLAMTFAIMTFIAGHKMLWSKNRAQTIAFIGGIFLVFSTEIFVAFIFLIAIAAYLLSMLFLKDSTTLRPLRRLPNLFILAGTAIALVVIFISANNDSEELMRLKLLFYHEDFLRYATDRWFLSEHFIFAIGALFAVLFLFRGFLTHRLDRRTLYYFLGIMTAFLLIFWQPGLFGLPDILDWRQVGVPLSAMLCIDGAVLFGDVLAGATKLIRDEAVAHYVMPSLSLLFVTSLWFVARPKTIHFGNTAEPDGFVRAVYQIKREILPYDWTAVSHYGTRTLVKNHGRFLDYAYFLLNYSPDDIGHSKKRLIPTHNLFIFTGKDSLMNLVDPSFLPNIRFLSSKLARWCREYQNKFSNISVYYQDDQVKVYWIYFRENGFSKRKMRFRL